MDTEQYYIIQRREGHLWIDWIKTPASADNKASVIQIFDGWKHLSGYRLVERTDTVRAVGG